MSNDHEFDFSTVFQVMIEIWTTTFEITQGKRIHLYFYSPITDEAHVIWPKAPQQLLTVRMWLDYFSKSGIMSEPQQLVIAETY